MAAALHKEFYVVIHEGNIGRCAQTEFNAAALIKITGAAREQIANLVPICLHRKVTPGRTINVEVALGVSVLAGAVDLGATAEQVARVQGPLIHAALIHLASDPLQWNATGRDAEIAQFRNLFFEYEGAGVRRMRLQTLLGIGDRKMHRFLVRRPYSPWSLCDDYDKRLNGHKEPGTTVFEAESVAAALAQGCSTPLFSWWA